MKAAPWTLAPGDPSVGGPYDRSLPTFAAGGTPDLTLAGVTYPNLAIDPGATDAPPYQSGVTGSPDPLPGYCGWAESGERRCCESWPARCCRCSRTTSRSSRRAGTETC